MLGNMLYLKQTLPKMEQTVLTRAIFIDSNLYFIGNSKVYSFNTHYTTPASYSLS